MAVLERCVWCEKEFDEATLDYYMFGCCSKKCEEAYVNWVNTTSEYYRVVPKPVCCLACGKAIDPCIDPCDEFCSFKCRDYWDSRQR